MIKPQTTEEFIDSLSIFKDGSFRVFILNTKTTTKETLYLGPTNEAQCTFHAVPASIVESIATLGFGNCSDTLIVGVQFKNEMTQLGATLENLIEGARKDSPIEIQSKTYFGAPQEETPHKKVWKYPDWIWHKEWLNTNRHTVILENPGNEPGTNWRLQFNLGGPQGTLVHYGIDLWFRDHNNNSLGRIPLGEYAHRTPYDFNEGGNAISPNFAQAHHLHFQFHFYR